MGALTNAIHAKLLDAVLGAVAYTGESTVKVRLTTTTPTQATPGTVVDTGDWTNYADLAVTNDATSFPNATVANPSEKSNGIIFDFGTATIPGSDVTILGMEVWNNAVTERIAWAGITSRIVQNTDEVKFAVGAVDFSMAPA